MSEDFAPSVPLVISGADTNLKSLAGLVSELWPSLLNWWRVAVLFFGERGRKGGGGPSAPTVSLVGSSFWSQIFNFRPEVLGVL